MRLEIIDGHAVGFDEGPHRYFIDGVEVPSVTKIIGGGKKTYYPQEAAERGTAIHSITARLDEGESVPGEEGQPYMGWLKAWSDFKRDYQFRLVAAECMGYSLGTMPHAGTIDRIATVCPPGGEEGRAIIDLKTGGKSPDHVLQVADYERLVTKYPGEIRWLMLVYLKNTGKYSVEILNRSARLMALAEFSKRQGEYRG